MNIQYDQIAKSYASSARTEHHQRKYRIYPSFLRVCGDLGDKKVLDLGCGNGFSSRLLAKKGALVVGIDNSLEMLKIAKAEELKQPLGIKYFLYNGTDNYKFNYEFDLISAVYFFHYAKSIGDLKLFFSNAANNLKSGGRLVAINNNPENPTGEYVINSESSGKWLGQPFVDGSEILISIYNKEGEILCNFKNYYWSKSTYEKTIIEAGFKNIKWSFTKTTEEGKKLCPNWQELENNPIVLILEAEKI